MVGRKRKNTEPLKADEKAGSDERVIIPPAPASAPQETDAGYQAAGTRGEPVSPEIASALIESLKQEIQDAMEKRDEYLDGWQRSMAEFTNYRRRVERDREQTYQDATGRVVKRYLEVLDDMERALKNAPKRGEGATFAEGIRLIYRKFQNILEAEGVKTMEVLGQPFDPTRHEAIGEVESPGTESGHVAEVILQGYMIGDRVVRPAMVRIAS